MSIFKRRRRSAPIACPYCASGKQEQKLHPGVYTINQYITATGMPNLARSVRSTGRPLV